MAVLSQLEAMMTARCYRYIADNLEAVVKTMPRWSARINQDDRDNLVQALSDLEFCMRVLRDGRQSVSDAARLALPDRSRYEPATEPEGQS